MKHRVRGFLEMFYKSIVRTRVKKTAAAKNILPSVIKTMKIVEKFVKKTAFFSRYDT